MAAFSLILGSRLELPAALGQIEFGLFALRAD
jgi:hypothetical protein